MVDEIINRSDYGLEEADMKFKKEQDFLNVPDSLDDFKKNPIYKPLSEFQKEFMKNERQISDKFDDLNKYITKFNNQISENYYYQDMDIVKLMQIILEKYLSWATSLRQNSFLAVNSMKEVKDIVKSYYVNRYDFDELVLQANEQLSEEREFNEILEVQKNTVSKKLFVEFPWPTVTKLSISPGDGVNFRKVIDKTSVNSVVDGKNIVQTEENSEP